MTNVSNLRRFVGLCVASMALVAIGSWLASGSFTHILRFNKVVFYLNYEQFGFIRRAFVGSVLYLFNARTPGGIIITSYVVIGVATLVFWGWMLQHSSAGRVRWPLFIAFLASPAVFLHFGFDLGRCDVINFTCAAIALWCIERRHYVSAGLIASIAILNHESFMFAYVSLLVAFTAYHTAPGHEQRWRAILAVALPPFAIDLLLTGYGGTQVNMDEVDAILDKLIDAGGDQYYYIKFTSIRYNIVTSLLNFVGSLRLNVYHLCLLVIYTMLLLRFLLAERGPVANTAEKWLIASCFAPLGLLFVSIDKGRWFSMIALNLALVFAVLPQEPCLTAAARRRMLAVLLLYGILCGPMTVSGMSFPQALDRWFIDRHHH